jgi:hypothetical protein
VLFDESIPIPAALSDELTLLCAISAVPTGFSSAT